MKPRYKWRPMQRAVALPPSEALIADYVSFGMAREEAVAHIA